VEADGEDLRVQCCCCLKLQTKVRFTGVLTDVKCAKKRGRAPKWILNEVMHLSLSSNRERARYVHANSMQAKWTCNKCCMEANRARSAGS
ncbi:hypothetical protein OAM67_01590, partial [bacterium]|nr:hypothetical protein [bacterium]